METKPSKRNNLEKKHETRNTNIPTQAPPHSAYPSSHRPHKTFSLDWFRCVAHTGASTCVPVQNPLGQTNVVMMPESESVTLHRPSVNQARPSTQVKPESVHNQHVLERTRLE